MNTICICGAGTMGSGIAQVSATAGFPTILFDVNNDMLEKAKRKMGSDLQYLIDRQKLTPEKKDEILGRIRFTHTIGDCRAAIIIEAIVEKDQAKKALFAELDRVNSPETIFASNTSSLSISAIAQGIPHPGRVAGLHFFNPAPLMKLVEVVRGRQTREEVIHQLVDLTKAMGKIPVVCLDSPGFIVNRVARPFYIESLRVAEEGGVSFETIDRLLENQGFRMGPFRLMDLIGNDINYAVSCSVYEQLNQPERLKPSSIQQSKVEKGELGKKTGKGYYDYS